MTKEINQEALVNDLAAMVRIPSVNGFADIDPAKPAEEAMAVHLETELSKFGLEVETQMVRNGRRNVWGTLKGCLLYTSPSPRDLSTSRMPSSA